MLVLGHGAGSPASSPLLRGFCEAVAEHGIATHRFDFPYMQAGRRAPDRATVLIAAYREAFDQALALAGLHVGEVEPVRGDAMFGNGLAEAAQER